MLKDVFGESLLGPISSRDPVLDTFPFDLGFSVRDLSDRYSHVDLQVLCIATLFQFFIDKDKHNPSKSSYEDHKTVA